MAKKKQKATTELKDFLTDELTKKPALLKILQTAYPETTKAFYCERLQFYNCEAACFNRILLWKPEEPACQNCHIHDDRLPWFKEFIDKENYERSDPT